MHIESKERFLVTGATGFIGSHLIKFLKKNIDDCNKSNQIRIISRRKLLQYDSIVCDLKDQQISHDALYGIDTVFHIAGYVGDLQGTPKNTSIYHIVNVEATQRLLDLAVHSGVKRFVFISTVKAGGYAKQDKCISEIDQSEPSGVYGKTKRNAELRVLEAAHHTDMHVSIVRPALVYGPGMKGNLAMMQAAVKKGWFPPLPETGNRRSMVHVDDLVRALMFVAKNKQANGQIYIVTDSVPHSSREIYEAIRHSVCKTHCDWSVPKWMFDLAGAMSSKVLLNLDKLFEDECYSSAKLEALGFKVEKGLMDCARSDFDVSCGE